MACNVNNTIFHMMRDLYTALKDFASDLSSTNYKIVLLHMQSPDKIRFYNIPIYLYSITNDHYTEISMEYTPKSVSESNGSSKCSTINKISNKIILSDTDEYNIQNLVKFIDSIIAHVLMTEDTYDAHTFKNYNARTIMRVCACDTNFCISYKPHSDENTTRLSTWSYDKTLVRSKCISCNEYNTFTTD